MSKMKAIVKQSKEPSDFALIEVTVPEINSKEILVKIKAIGVGIHDGYYMPGNMEYPYPIGIEAAGIIEEIGENVTGFKVGDPIVFISMLQEKGGTWAQYAVVSKDALIVGIPKGMTFEEAAAIPVAANAAQKAFHALNLKRGDSLFIAGASGAIGTFAIQLAKAQGYVIAGSASEKNHEHMLALGADKVVDYRDPSWPERIKGWMPGGVDAVIAIQPGTGIESIEVVKDGGKIVAVSGDQIAGQRNIEVKQFPYHINMGTELAEIIKQISQGEIKVFIEEIYDFEKALEALQKKGTRHARGKSVIVIP